MTSDTKNVSSADLARQIVATAAKIRPPEQNRLAGHAACPVR
jgi:hypothetical protein